MARSTDLREKINYNTVDNISSFISKYDKEADTLFIQPKEPLPAVSIDLDGDFWVRMNPDNGDIVGIEIEDYKELFSKKYSLLRGHSVTSPIVKAFVIDLLKLGPKPFSREDFIADLKAACRGTKVYTLSKTVKNIGFSSLR